MLTRSVIRRVASIRVVVRVFVAAPVVIVARAKNESPTETSAVVEVAGIPMTAEAAAHVAATTEAATHTEAAGTEAATRTEATTTHMTSAKAAAHMRATAE